MLKKIKEARERHLSKRRRKPGGPVGTEAVALQQLEHNKKHFQYPPGGFEVPIEYTLLYSMIYVGPSTYPAPSVIEQIQQEDFDEYLMVNTEKEMDPPLTSYAQLSAILAVSSVQWPPPNEATDERRPSSSRRARSATIDDEKKETSDQQNVGEFLVKTLLRYVVRHAERHGLDRKHEVNDFLRLVQVYGKKREGEAAMRQIVPMYLGYAASIVTGNPIPVMVGVTMSIKAGSKHAPERENMDAIYAESLKKSDVEKASLLDEQEDLYESD